MNNAIYYTIIPKDLAAHLYTVTVTVNQPDEIGQCFSLPAWIPGSYMIREFAKNIVQISAESDGKKVGLSKLDKHTWIADECIGPLTVSYEVYAWDLSVRTAHLDQTHGFFNGTSVFLRVQDREESVHIVDIQKPQGEDHEKWRVATAMRQLDAKRYGFGTYIASNYDELIDHPVELGTFALATFKAHGVQHDVVFTGKVPNFDLPRLTADLKKICETQIAFFEPKSKRAPVDRYVFMTMVVGDGYGGLEHRASTALICSRADLPVKGQQEMSDGYRTFLGLCSHEYFHTWNVKRIKPAAFVPYDLATENYTPLLWLFEGFTSYYDDLMLVRSGVIDESAYLKLVAKTVNSVLRGSGRHKQSVAESSFDAWSKYYRQDESATNSIVSYYTKGSLVGLALDLTIRAETKGKKSLDDVMLALWQQYGRDFYQGGSEGRGVTENEVDDLFDSVTGLKLKRVLDRWVRGTDDLPLSKLLTPFGIAFADERKNGKPGLGWRTVRDGNDCKVANVYESGTAHKAGVSAGDVLVAIDGLRVTGTNLDGVLGRYRVGDAIALHVFRRDELLNLKAKVQVSDAPNVTLTAEAKPTAAVRLRDAWLK
ncbi:M61 family metallopeptidase [Herminiimonas fonticola]|uniref:Putative metalloprotease with PDZ domain n=1 Tax=Herminiimonas fonticola TaxID=303380 RepID=A0A4R6GHD3_9BURK|nr:PDZ domain-containing protein [Herminiimonas fonticola]RBA24378.1 Protease [Herminiimonas fonticola]TDN93495.1 putative metalloprotease with PDZ domain [Herminiimonas fonticola]